MRIEEMKIRGGTNSKTGERETFVTLHRLPGNDGVLALVDGFDRAAALLIHDGMTSVQREGTCGQICERLWDYWAQDDNMSHSYVDKIEEMVAAVVGMMLDD